MITRFSECATSENERARRLVNAEDADRWLAFLAAHLARNRSYDMDWSRLRHALPVFGTPLRWAAFGGGLAWLLTGTLFGISRGLTAGAGAGILSGFWQGMDAALVVGAIYLLAPFSYPASTVVAPWLQWLRRHIRTPLRMAAAIPAAYAIESGLRDGTMAATHDGLARGILVGLMATALNWLVAAAVLGLATRARLMNQAENPVYFSMHMPGRSTELAKTVAAGLLWGAGLGLAAGYGIKILSSLLAHEHPLWVLGIPVGGGPRRRVRASAMGPDTRQVRSRSQSSFRATRRSEPGAAACGCAPSSGASVLRHSLRDRQRTSAPSQVRPLRVRDRPSDLARHSA